MNRLQALNPVTIVLMLVMLLAGFSTMLSTQMQSSIPALTMVYVVVILTLGWTKPYYVLLLSMASAPFVMNVSGTDALKFSLTEVNILLLSISMLGKLFLTKQLVSLGKLTLPVVLYLAIAAISSVQGGVVTADIIALLQTAIFCFLCPILAINAKLTPEQNRSLLFAYAIPCLLLAALQLSLGVGKQVMGIHKNNMGQNLATGLVVWICLWMDSYRGWWTRFTVPAMLVTLLGLFLTLSRGAWVGAVIGLIVIALLNRRFVFLVRILALVVPFIALMWIYLPDDSKEYAAGVDSKMNRNIAARFYSRDVALSAFKQNPLIGVGVSLRKQMDATNLVFVTLGESGILGLLSFFTIQVTYIVLVVRLIKSIPRTDPRFFLLVVSPTLMAVRLTHGQFDHYWVRGATTMAWVSVGVVLAIAADEKKRLRLLGSPPPLAASHSILENGAL
jgi:O-antigen ligase